MSLTVSLVAVTDVGGSKPHFVELFSANVTHNLNHMAHEAEIYEHLWRPNEIGITQASQLIKPLRNGITMLLDDPSKFKNLNPSNGWGSYKDFVPWVKDYLVACETYPEAIIAISR